MKEFEQIYEEYFQRIYSFLYRLCKNEALAEEMAQETFFRAFVSFDRYNGKCELFTWLAAIGKNVWLMYLRKNRIKTVELDLAVYDEGGIEPEMTYERKYRAECVKKAIDSLPPKYRDVVILRIYAELSYAHIASVLKISEGSAKVIFHRAKEILKKELIEKINS